MTRILCALAVLATIAVGGCFGDKPPPPNFEISQVKHAPVPAECKRRVKRLAPPPSIYNADGSASFGAYASATDQYDALAGRFNACQTYYERELSQ